MKKLLILICALSVLSAHADEYIAEFSSDITVNADSSMDVRETIIVKSDGSQIKRGIVREFPTQYSDTLGTKYVVGFELKSVTRDGFAATYDVESRPNGVAVYIRQKNRYLNPGFYTFQIHYTTNRQLGFFTNHDELYWNVTGNGWRLPIKKVRAIIHLPEAIPTSEIQAQAFTGYQDSQGTDYKVSIDDHTVTINSTRPFHEYEGLTFVTIWPKGYIQEPTATQKLIWFIRDNIFIIWIFAALILLLLAHLWYHLVSWRANKPGIVIPLFYPPKDLGSADIGFIKQKAFSDNLVTAQLVDLAVRGFLTIESEEVKHFFTSVTVYTLKKTIHTIDEHPDLKKHELEFLKTLFGNAHTVTLKSGHNEKLLAAKQYLEQHLVRLTIYWNSYPGIFMSWMVTAFCGAIGLLVLPLDQYWMLFPSLLGAAAINVLIAYFNPAYTKEGRALCDEIDGFKLYLTTAELDRIKMVGTPPTKTPELYEYYLPYAIALGVEYAWTAQFQSLFADLERRGHPYRPLWYLGGAYNFNRLSRMNNSLSAAMTPVSSSRGRPGGSSGWGGGGRSGGGGGGGGGGGC